MRPQAVGRKVPTRGPVALNCPYCLSTDIWSEDLPRGDSPVECRSCSRIHIYAYVEMFALDRIRRAIHDNHPERELAEMDRAEAEMARMERKRSAA
jgi:hypothetical protein